MISKYEKLDTDFQETQTVWNEIYKMGYKRGNLDEIFRIIGTCIYFGAITYIIN